MNIKDFSDKLGLSFLAEPLFLQVFRRIKETIGIRYEDIGVMGVIVEDVKAMLQGHEEIDAAQTLIVNFNTFGPSSLDFFIYTFTKTTNWIHYHEVKQDVLLKVAGIIDRHAAQIAFPMHTVHIDEGASTPEKHRTKDT